LFDKSEPEPKKPNYNTGSLGLAGARPAPQAAVEKPPEAVARPPADYGQALIAQLQIADARSIIAAIEQNRRSKVICLTYNDTPPIPSGLGTAVIGILERALSEIGRVPRLDLLLRTTGGALEVPWRVVSLLREFTSELGVIVSRTAFSAGCHIALAADDLVMGPFAALSSVDPTRQHALLPKDAANRPIPTSVQELKHCVQFIREQLGDGHENQNVALIISELFKYVNPLALGALEQSYKLARLITRKVLNTRRSKLSEEQIEKVVDTLSGGYYSHAYHISRAEVETDLGLAVTRPDEELSRLIADFENYYSAEYRKVSPAVTSPKEQLVRVGGLLETTTSGWAITMLYKPDGTPVADPWAKFR
jgi:hypothetical protein